MDERGQTQYDFAIGISIFLLVLVGVLAFLPGMLQAYDNPVGADQRAEADRVAETLVADHRVAGDERTLLLSGDDGLAATLTDANFTSSREAAGVPSYRRVNVTLVDGAERSDTVEHGSSAVSVGRDYENQPAATVVRVVRFEDAAVCEPLCRLTVRVW